TIELPEGRIVLTRQESHRVPRERQCLSADRDRLSAESESVVRGDQLEVHYLFLYRRMTITRVDDPNWTHVPLKFTQRAFVVLNGEVPRRPATTKGTKDIDLGLRDRRILRGELRLRFGEGALGVEAVERVDGALALLRANDGGGLLRLFGRGLQSAAAFEA